MKCPLPAAVHIGLVAESGQLVAGEKPEAGGRLISRSPSESGLPDAQHARCVRWLVSLFDEQLSEDLCEGLADVHPGSLHVRLLGRGGAADATVWDVARQYGCLIVSKDADFHRFAVARCAAEVHVG